MVSQLAELIPKKEKLGRRQLSVDGNTYEILKTLADKNKLSVAATVKALALFYIENKEE